MAARGQKLSFAHPPRKTLAPSSSIGGLRRHRRTRRRATSVGQVAAMRHLVQSECHKALPISGKHALESFWLRRGRFVEVFLTERFEEFQIALPQLNILLADLG